MRIVIIFPVFIIIGILLIAAPTFIYVKIYQGRINKRISNINDKSSKQMLEPFRFCIIWSASVVILSILFIVIINNAVNSDISDSLGSYYFEIYEGDEIPESYIANFSMEENAGYVKAEKEEKDFRVTAFYSKEDYDGLHPSFIVYVQYTGNEEYVAQDVYGSFGDNNGLSSGQGYTGGDGERIICFAGYINEEAEFITSFKGRVYYMDEDNMKLSKENENEEGIHINTGCRFTLYFKNKSIDLDIVGQ